MINRFLHGIVISGGTDGSELTGVEIKGNFIGIDATGQGDLGNGLGGVLLIGLVSNSVKDNTIGGTSPEARNLISGNGGGFGDGVTIINAENNKVEGNLIGTKKDGTSPLGNTGEGVSISSSSGNSVGGAFPGTANTIAFNSATGVTVQSFSPGNSILGNSIYSNGRLGIDLFGNQNADGRTPNDPGDADAGPNALQNFPKITFAEKASGKTTIKGKLNSTPSSKRKKETFTIQFFSNPQGEDEGKTFLGQKRVTTDRRGKASFTFETSQPVTGRITATATDSAGNTSEVSDPLVVATG